MQRMCKICALLIHQASFQTKVVSCQSTLSSSDNHDNTSKRRSDSRRASFGKKGTSYCKVQPRKKFLGGKQFQRAFQLMKVVMAGKFAIEYFFFHFDNFYKTKKIDVTHHSQLCFRDDILVKCG